MMKTPVLLTATFLLAWTAPAPVVAQGKLPDPGRENAKQAPSDVVRVDAAGKLTCTWRGFIRKRIGADGRANEEFKKSTGSTNVAILSYKVLLLEPGSKKKRFVDERQHAFQIGQKVLLQVETDTDMYVYVAHLDVDGKLTMVLPDDLDKKGAPLVRRDDKPKDLPEDGYFEIEPPVGTERIFLCGARTKRDPKLVMDELKALANPKTAGQKKPRDDNHVQFEIRVGQVPPDSVRGQFRREKVTEKEGNIVLTGSKTPGANPQIFVEIPIKIGAAALRKQ